MSIKARQAREAIALLAEQTHTRANERREALAAAVKAWSSVVEDYSFGKPTQEECDEADLAFEAVLVATGVTKASDTIHSFYWDASMPTMTGLTVVTDTELIFVDQQGNVTRGAAA